MKFPTCEVCKGKEANAFSWFHGEGWLFVCGCAVKRETYYYIEFEHFFSSRDRQTEWLRQLEPKRWMDWIDFSLMLARFAQSAVTDREAA